jgi:FKBP-type peptidyl-prolyl cis-trans isomerase
MMKKLSTTEWIGVGVAVVVVFAFLGPGFGLFNNLSEPQVNETDPMREIEYQEPFQVVPGVQAQILKSGEGDSAETGNLVAVHYVGRLEDGTVFDSSYERGEPFSFNLGAGQVIPGWDAGVVGMKEGEVRQLVISPEMAYGPAGIRHPQTGEVIIPENATLIFDVELLDAGISRR